MLSGGYQDRHSAEEAGLRRWKTANLADLLRSSGVARYNAHLHESTTLPDFIDFAGEKFNGADLTGLDCTGMQFLNVAGKPYDPKLLAAYEDWKERRVSVVEQMKAALLEVFKANDMDSRTWDGIRFSFRHDNAGNFIVNAYSGQRDHAHADELAPPSVSWREISEKEGGS